MKKNPEEQENRNKIYLSEEKCRNIFNSMADVFYRADSNGIIELISPSVEKVLGYSVEKITGKPISQYYFNPQKADELMNKIKESREIPDYEAVMLHKNGAKRIFFSNVKSIIGKSGNFAGIEVISRDITQRTRAELALVENEEKFRKLVSGLNDVIFRVSLPEGHYEYISPAAENVYGYKPEAFYNKQFFLQEILHPDSKDYYIEKINNLLSGDIHNNLEFKIVTSDGKEKWIYQSTKGVFQNDSLTAIEGIARDITEIKTAAIKIAKSELKYKTLINSLPHKVFYKDIHSVYQAVNDIFAGNFHLTADQVVGKTDFDLFPEELAKKNQASDATVIKTEKTKEIEEECFNKGEKRKASTIKTPVFDPEGKISGILGISWDITERVKLQEERNRLFNYSIDMFCVAGFDGWFKQLNPAWSKILGWTNEELFSQPFIEFVHPEDIDRTIKNSNQLKDGQTVTFFLNRYLCKNGSYKWISWNSFPLMDKNLIFAVARDVTDRHEIEESLKKSEQELRNLNAQKDRFFSIIAHDLKSPIGLLMQLSELLYENFDSFEKEELREIINHLYNSSHNTFKLLENLLIWSRGQLDRIEVNKTIFDIHKIVKATLKIYKEKATLKELIIQNNIKPLTFVFADKDMVMTVLRNLVSNAIKFTNRSGEIKISAEKIIAENKRKMIQVSVRDNGIGIAKEDQEKLFKIDEYITTPGTEKEKGTGLGLLVCKEMIIRNNGKISIDSQPGNGACISFTLLHEPVY